MRSRTKGVAVTLVTALASGAVVSVFVLSDDDTGGASAEDPPPSVVSVSCAPGGITVSDDVVTATSSGVLLKVASTLPTGAYLTVSNPDGSGGGDPLPKAPETRAFSVAPGTFSVACRSKGADPSDLDIAEIAVADPDHYWRTTTLADHGCPGLSELDLGPASGATLRAAVDALVPTLEGPTRDYTARDAQVGYLAATSQTWLAYRRGVPYVSINLHPDETGYTAYPGVLC
jgi:hypothetical protein